MPFEPVNRLLRQLGQECPKLERRGFFHASEDPSGIRDTFLRSLRDLGVSGRFEQRVKGSGIAWHPFIKANPIGSVPPVLIRPEDLVHAGPLERALLLWALHSWLDDDYDAIHLCIADSPRQKASVAHEWIARAQYYRLRMQAANYSYSFRFPPVSVRVITRKEWPNYAGLQLCDYLLWVEQRQACQLPTERPSASWSGLGGDASWGYSSLTLGQGCSRPWPWIGAEAERSWFAEVNVRFREEEIYETVAVVSKVAQHEPRIFHLSDLLSTAARAGRRRSADRALVGAAFLLICSTLPYYEPRHPFAPVDVSHCRAIAGRMFSEESIERDVRGLVRFSGCRDVPVFEPS